MNQENKEALTLADQLLKSLVAPANNTPGNSPQHSAPESDATPMDILAFSETPAKRTAGDLNGKRPEQRKKYGYRTKNIVVPPFSPCWRLSSTYWVSLLSEGTPQTMRPTQSL